MANEKPNKVILGNEVLIDLTDTTATADKVLTGYDFYGADGVKTTGTAEAGGETIILVNYSNEFRGLTISCTKSGSTTTKVAPIDKNQVRFYPTETGEYTISVTYEGQLYPTTATILEIGDIVECSLEYLVDGKTVLPTDSVEIWLKCAKLESVGYTTLAQVLADSETYNALLGDSNACAYMARSTTWTTDICADALAMAILGRYDVACDALLSNATWAEAIANSTYFESVLNTKVPTMTSNTTPSGVASASSELSSNYRAWGAFTDDATKYWACSSGAGRWIQYEFASAVTINALYLTTMQQGVKKFKVQGSNDGFVSDTHDLTSEISVDSVSGDTLFKYAILNDNAYKYYRVYIIEYWDNSYIQIKRVQFYGRTSSGAKIHGATGESAYILESGSPVTVADPSTLDAGTYTFYSTVAKDPANLSNDYSKTIRICPNTKEIVLMPDAVSYWYGYKVGDTANYKARASWTNEGDALTFNTMDATLAYTSGGRSRARYTEFTTPFDLSNCSKLRVIYGSTPSLGEVNISTSSNMYFGAESWRSAGGVYESYVGITTALGDNSSDNDIYDPSVYAGAVLIEVMSGASNVTIHALWAE